MKLSNRLVIGAVLGAASLQASAVELKTTEEKISYIVGMNYGQQIKADNVPFEEAAFLQAIKDVLNGTPPRLNQEEAQAAIAAFQQQRQAEVQKLAEQNKRDGEQFLTANSNKPGVKVTDSGLQYKVIKAGSGKQPTPESTVSVNYRGTLIDGTEFDSSYKRGQPATFPVNGVIKGWTEALQMMKEGAKWELYIPADLAYGERGAGSGVIGPNATLVFEVELLEVK